MKFKVFISLLIATVTVCSCEKIDEIDNKDKDETNVWIEKTMRQWYLWEDEIPASDKLDFTADAEKFFGSMLSEKDGKGSGSAHYYYSSIKKKKATKSYMGDDFSFGFEFQYYNITSNGETLYHALHVLYVLPESPAAEKGLKRGDWILKINKKDVPDSSADLLKMMYTSQGTEIVLGVNTELPKTPVAAKEISVTSRMVVDNPVFVDTTYVYGDNKSRIAYLVFNHFTSGTDDASEKFHDSLRDAFARFKASQPQDFILDLRYNTGGLVKTAQLLSTMLAPAVALNDTFCLFTYNRKYQQQNNAMKLEAAYMTNGNVTGANLDLKRLFVITSSRTASASEAVINCLEPYMKGQIIIVGSKTEGKNVASSTFPDDRYDWELHPIISRISNKEGFSDYASGFEPTYPCTDMYEDKFYELGDLNEFMLRQVVDYIAYGSRILPDGRTRSAALQLIPSYSSIERRATNGVILNRIPGL